MRLVNIHPQIFLVLSDSLTELGQAFVRLQEFYESPSKRFRGKYFKLGDFIEWYCKTQSRSGSFTYYWDFGGYNVPGNVVEKFISKFKGKFTEQEIALLRLLGWGHSPFPEKFYVIGAPEDSVATIDHEISHALFHIFPSYARYMTRNKDEDTSGIRKYLKDHMYSPDMYDDETASYLMFDINTLRRNGVKTKHLKNLREWMLSIYRFYKKDFINGI